ncbi:hypothetical protein D9611_009687 [Ephemerocybe angulata]|uniref:Uncharacterized protein n=1 Tax=Ephemerocybe angulata TaxID=980116 RepID=A0A8H5C7X0_9AGAR|nr:hypothetical protein D9611_009687 [Tulosesus angulatus]
MSSFEPGFWIPSSVTFDAAFLDTGLNFYDSLVATLICTLFSGIHLCMCRRIMILHFRLAENKGRSHMQNAQTLVLMVLSILFAALFIGSSFIYCVQFSRNAMLLRTTAPRTGAAASAGTILGCTGASFGEAGRKCVEVSISALQAGRRVELAFASMTQILIFLTDMLLVVRCYFVFKDKPQVYITAAVAFVASFAIWIFGLASLSKAGGLSASASWDWDLTGPSSALPKGYTSSMSIISSLIVNIIVTVSIVTRILRAQRRLQDNLSMSRVGAGQRDGVYLSASALLIESALPPVVFGILAAVFASTNIKEKRKAFEFELIPKMAWAAFTASLLPLSFFPDENSSLPSSMVTGPCTPAPPRADPTRTGLEISWHEL